MAELVALKNYLAKFVQLYLTLTQKKISIIYKKHEAS